MLYNVLYRKNYLPAHKPSNGVIEYTDCISAEEQDSPTGVLDMTINNLMLRLQFVLWGMWSTPSLQLLPGPL